MAKKIGGFQVHYRERFGECELALVPLQETNGGKLNLKVVTNSAEQFIWKAKTPHGAGKEKWHWGASDASEGQCEMTDHQIREDDAKATEKSEKVLAKA